MDPSPTPTRTTKLIALAIGASMGLLCIAALAWIYSAPHRTLQQILGRTFYVFG